MERKELIALLSGVAGLAILLWVLVHFFKPED